jgi:hypothetical protein
VKWRVLLFAALGLIGAGYFGPWAAHKDAGLNLAADDLAEFVKFMPVVRSDEIGIMRELFYVPIWLTSLGLGLLASRIKSFGLRLALLALSLLLVFTPLPGFTFLLTAYRSPEFGLTFWATVGVMLIAIGLTVFGGRILRSDRVEALLWIVLGLAAASIAPLHFVKVAPEIDRLYHFAVGWGVIAVVAGGLGLALIGVAWLIIKKTPGSFKEPGV